MAKRVVLHYGGQEYKLAEGEGGVLGGLDMIEPGLVSVPLDNGGRVTILTGPGIPVAVVEEERSRTVVFGG